MGSVTTPERAEDSIEMARIVFGERFTDEHCVIMGNINMNSPLVYDRAMSGSLRAYARANQCPVVVPFILGDAFRKWAPGTTSSDVLIPCPATRPLFMRARSPIPTPTRTGVKPAGKNSMTRANAKWKETLRAYESPPLDVAVDEALKEFMARKKASMPDIWH